MVTIIRFFLACVVFWGLNPFFSLASVDFFDENKNSYTIQSCQGRPLVVHVWASWCAPCVRELPSLDAVTPRIEAAGGRVLAISIDPWIDKVLALFHRQKIRHLKAYHDPSSYLYNKLGCEGLPTTILMNEAGQQVFYIRGALDWSGNLAWKILQEHINLRIEP